MPSYTFYQPLYFDIERLVNAGLLSKQGKAAPVSQDLHEDTEKNVVTATFKFPGVSKDEVQLNLQNGKLTVSAETKKSEENAESGYTLRERRQGKFSRALQLADGVQDEQIKATMENGILTVIFPKHSPELAPKKIIISDA